MAVFRAEKKRGFTVMANHHLRDMRLSLRARGLHSLLLSLPEDWDYSLRGLAAICREGVDALAAALGELEQCGYVRRTRPRDERGRLGPARYDIFELPDGQEGGGGNPGRGGERSAPAGGRMPPKAPEEMTGERAGRADRESQRASRVCAGAAKGHAQVGEGGRKAALLRPARVGKPAPGNPAQATPVKGPAPQPNTEGQKTEGQIRRSGRGQGMPEDSAGPPPMDAVRCAVRRRIEAEYLAKKFEAARVEEVVWLLADVLCSTRRRVRIGGEERDMREVCRRLESLTAGHVEYVLAQMDACAPAVRNIRAYLLACLYNAPATIESYWQAQVCHDLRGVRRAGG